jgi:hypothetical protein
MRQETIFFRVWFSNSLWEPGPSVALMHQISLELLFPEFETAAVKKH